ncbi:hypothetical protein [Demequina salsinemoris]|uniref:hypothetical protein n=1 Tax=Demequina salsinemoris TaxID=577470 RepID=UPI000A4CC5EA|nr:hypothetical protein [Demequina salsinemoris]
MSMTSSDSRAGLRVLGGVGLVCGYAAFGIPAAVSSTWGTVEQAASNAASREEITILAVWIALGVLALVVGTVSLALVARRRRAARGGSSAEQSSREQPATGSRPVSSSPVPAHA